MSEERGRWVVGAATVPLMYLPPPVPDLLSNVYYLNLNKNPDSQTLPCSALQKTKTVLTKLQRIHVLMAEGLYYLFVEGG